MLTLRRRGLGEPWETKFSAGVPVTALLRCMQKRDSVSHRVFPETLRSASRKTERPFQAQGAYRTVQTRPVSSRSVHHGTSHGTFPDVYFYTQSLQRPHKRRPMASRREQVSALFFVAWTQRRLTECFPWAAEGPNPPKETLTFKKEFFWQTTSPSLPAGLKGNFSLHVYIHTNFLLLSRVHYWQPKLCKLYFLGILSADLHVPHTWRVSTLGPVHDHNIINVDFGKSVK